MRLKTLFVAIAAVSLGTFGRAEVMPRPIPPHPAPSITSQPQSLTVDSGNPALFSVTASGTAPFAYQWLKNGIRLLNGGNILGATSNTLSLNPTTTNDAGSYTVIVTNGSGSATSSAAILTVIFVPPSIIGQPCNVAVSNTQSALFTVFAAGSPPLSYQWFKDAAPLTGNARISGATAGALTINNVTLSDAGLYSVTISNSGFVVTSTPALLSVDVPDKTAPVVVIASPRQNSRVTNASVSLSGTAKSAIGIGAVWFQVNNGGWILAATANRWSNWTANAVLAAYTNKIQACAVDDAGNLSAIKAANVTYALLAPLLVRTSGSGAYTPNYSGQLLQIGKSYTVTAKPKAAYVFSSWTMATDGGVFSNSASSVLTFVMQSGLQLTANFAAPPPLEVAFSVSKTNLVESGTFTAQVTVKNTGTARVNGAHVDGEALNLDDGWTGFAVPTKFISPAITSIGPKASVTFLQRFKATTTGTFRLHCVIDSSIGSSDISYSPYITVFPSKIGVQPRTDNAGNARLVAGHVSLPVNLYDEETGSSLSGFVLGLALDPGRAGQAVLAAVDTAGRYPPQFFLLHGPSAPTEASLRRAADSGVIVAGAEKTDLSKPAPQTVSIPIDQPCGGTVVDFQHVMAPIPTTSLPSLANLPVPPSPAHPGQDNSQPPLDVLLAAWKSAVATAKELAISRKVVDCDDVLADDALGAVAGKATDFIFGEAPERFLSVVAPETVGIYTAFMAADAANGYFQAFRDLALCAGPSASGVVLQTTLLPKVAPYLNTSFLAWNTQYQPDETPLPLVTAAVEATDSNGNPISGGSIEMFSADHLGGGFRAVIEDGTADLPVLLGNYSVCARAPGFVTQSEQVSITSNSAVIHVTMAPLPVKSATLTSAFGQSTGFLPKGTQFILTPHFFDANGHEVQCTGQPIFYVHNPVGSTVATVDPASGMVTIEEGCGAASVTAWCNGIESAPRLVSSDCNGSQPPAAFSTFALNPTHLTFSAIEGEGSPGSQTVYIVTLKSGALTYTADPNRSWISVGRGDGSATVSVDSSGLGPGTYGGMIYFFDSAAVQNHAEVAVTLVITPKSTPHGGGGGSAQTWTMVSENETATLAVDSNGNFTGSGWYFLDTSNGSHPLSIHNGKMSGSEMTFEISGSGGGMTASGSGSGTLNAPFPSASSASGSATIHYTSPLGTTSGSSDWTATRNR